MEIGEFKCIKNMLDSLKLLTRSHATEQTYLNGVKYFMKAYGIEDLDAFVNEVKEGKRDANEVYKDWVLRLSFFRSCTKNCKRLGFCTKKAI
ncbi:MAG: hypothetical protein ACP5LN_10980 [Thermoproteota archaeon]